MPDSITGGLWRGRRLIGDREFGHRGQRGAVRGWNGGNSSTLSAWAGGPATVIAAVTTAGIDWRDPPFAALRPGEEPS